MSSLLNSARLGEIQHWLRINESSTTAQGGHIQSAIGINDVDAAFSFKNIVFVEVADEI